MTSHVVTLEVTIVFAEVTISIIILILILGAIVGILGYDCAYERQTKGARVGALDIRASYPRQLLERVVRQGGITEQSLSVSSLPGYRTPTTQHTVPLHTLIFCTSVRWNLHLRGFLPMCSSRCAPTERRC